MCVLSFIFFFSRSISNTRFLRVYVFLCFFKQKTAYEMRISDWSSDVCSSDLSSQRQNESSAARQVFRKQLREGKLDDKEIEIKLVNPTANMQLMGRSEESRVGQEWFRTCRSRWTPYH